jgi:superoxide dismutase, Cu-Zn family
MLKGSKVKMLGLSGLLLAGVAFAGHGGRWGWGPSSHQVVVSLHHVDENGVGQDVGTVTITESDYGLVFTPALKDLPAGLHGFHLHQNPSCDPQEKDGKMTPAQAAGGHYDPMATNVHDTPWGNGHLGDLPPLFVDTDGTATHPVLAPRLRFRDLFDHALMVHAGGDNHSDHPAALGGGGTRMSCGVITRQLISAVPSDAPTTPGMGM